jgi:hypothetical protein
MLNSCLLCGRERPEYVGLYIPGSTPNRQYWYALCVRCYQRPDWPTAVESRCATFGRYIEWCKAASMN